MRRFFISFITLVVLFILKFILIESDVLSTAGNLYILVLIGVLSGIIPHAIDDKTKVDSEIICDGDKSVSECFMLLNSNLITKLDRNNCIEYFMEYTTDGKYKCSASIVAKKRGDI